MEDKEFEGSRFLNPTPNITIGCISPESRDLLETIMEHWEAHYKQLKGNNGEDYEPTYYGFAYWLVRWSGLIQPTNSKTT